MKTMKQKPIQHLIQPSVIASGGLLGGMNGIRNFGVAAHVDAGKTTLTERILFYAGATHKLGDVDAGTTITDTDPLERMKGITISSAVVSCHWNEHQLNLIDTPGHADFTAEVERSLRVLDGAVVVFCGVAGVEPQSETVWRQADRYGVPRIVFVNKMDRIGADFDRVVAQVRDQLGANPLPVLRPLGAESELDGLLDVIGLRVIRQLDDAGMELRFEEPDADLRLQLEIWRNELVEAVAETDDVLAENYLLGEPVSEADLHVAIRRQTIARNVVPVVGGSAFRCRGVQGLLDAVCAYLPSPADVPEIEAQSTDGTKVTVRANREAPFCALVFKPQRDSRAGRLFFLRVYAGEVRKGDVVFNPVTGKKVRLGRLLRIQSDRHTDVERVQAGDIAAAVGLKDTRTGDTLCALGTTGESVLLEPPRFPEPVISMAIEPVAEKDRERLGEALRNLAEDDPTLAIRVDPETGQTLVAGMGELHLEIVGRKLADTAKVDARLGAPQVAYRETITREAKGDFFLSKQTGGPGMYAKVALTVRPNPVGEGITFANRISGGAIPVEYHSACEKGVRAALRSGVLGGYPVVDVHVDLLDGEAHSNDSSDLAFHMAAQEATRLALGDAEPVLLEPVLAVRIDTPEEAQGSMIGELGTRRGVVRQVEAGRVTADVPVAELFGFHGRLMSLSSGRASFGAQPTGFAPVPAGVAKTVLKS